MITLSKKLALFIFIIQPFLVWAANYTSTVNGNWSSSSTWSPSGVPGSTDTVTIANTVTLDANESVYSITINSSKTLTVSSSNTLTVYGNFTDNGTFTYSTGTVTFAGSVNETIGGSSTISFYNLTTYPSASTDTVFINKAIYVNNNFTISEGVFACKTFTITGNTSGTMSMASGTTLVLGLTSSSTLSYFPSTFTNAHISLDVASTVVFQANNTSTGQAISSLPYYGNLLVTTSSAGTAGSNVFVVKGNLTIASGITFKEDAGTADTIKGNLVINSGATYDVYSSTEHLKGNVTNNGTYHSTYTTYFDGSTNQVLNGANGSINTFFNGLIIQPTSVTDTTFIEANIKVPIIDNYGTVFVPSTCNDTIELIGALNTAGKTFTALNGVVYFTSGYLSSCDINGSPVILHNLTVNQNLYIYNNVIVSSDLTRLSGSLPITDTLFLAGNYIDDVASVTTGSIDMNGNHNQTISGTAYPYLALLINQASTTDTVKLSDSTTFYTLTIAKGTLDVTPSKYSITVIHNFMNNGNFVARNGTVTFNNSAANQTLGGSSVTTFNNVTHIGGYILSLGNNEIVKGNVLISSGEIDASSSNYAITVGGNFTNNGTFNQRSGLVTLNGNANQIIGGTHSLTFYNLTQKQASATDTVFLGEGITVSHNLADSGGVFDCQNYQIIGNNSGTFTMASGTNMLLGSASSSTNITFPTLFTTAHTTLNSGSTISYLANTAQTISSTPTTYGNLTLGSGSNTTRKTPASSPLAIAGNLNINANTTLVENTGTINLTGNLCNADSLVFTTGALNIGGSFTNNGVLTAGTGTVTLNGTAGQTIGGIAVTTFYNLTGSSSGTETITLGNNETVSHNFLISSGTFTLAGASYNLNVAGNFTNNSSLTASSGTVVMNGSGTQTLGGSAVSNFYNLTVNGTTSTVVNLGNNQKVSQNLNVSTGSLNTSTYHIN